MSHSLLISWGPENEIGIPIIDEQHRGIVTLINSFGFSIQHGQQTEFYLNTIFSMMDGYTKLHFATEEEFLRLAGYAELESHKGLHAALIKKSFAIASESMRLRDPEIYLQFLKEWWMTHINHCDRLYAPTMKKYLAL
ncbi:MAG: bacteriohemerythrin [Desulfovibrionaceae bacterium]|nr:bacteriohemerythrin [Desulfovibrionaceae bacterium]